MSIKGLIFGKSPTKTAKIITPLWSWYMYAIPCTYCAWRMFHVSIVLCVFPVEVRCSQRGCISHVPMQAI